jgi:hypothetical protein
MSLKYLKTQAKQAAEARGHRLSRFKSLHSHTAVADCINRGGKCSASVYVTDKPLPNETNVAGDAVAVNCGSVDFPTK